MIDIKERLLEILVEKSFLYSEEPIYKLQSGKLSSYYINCKTTTLNPEGMVSIGRLLFENFIQGKNIQAVGGLTLGADPIAFSVAMHSFTQKSSVHPFVIRKEPKGHGLNRWIEGEVFEGERVAIIDDVVTTGESTIKAIHRARESNLKVEFAVSLVDREEGGMENILKEGIDLFSLFTKTDLFNFSKGSKLWMKKK